MPLPIHTLSDAKGAVASPPRSWGLGMAGRLLALAVFLCGAFLFQQSHIRPWTCSHAPSKVEDSELRVTEAYAFERLIGNIGGASNETLVPNVMLGTVVASPATAAPDYFYAWTRDGSFVGKLIVDFFLQSRKNNSDGDWDWGTGKDRAPVRNGYTGWEVGTTQLTRPLRILAEDWILSEFFHQLSSARSPYGQGEPKFYVDGSLFTGPWGRPQADGPALRATAMMKFARTVGLDDPFVRTFLYHANLDGRSLIKDDLEWLSHNWKASSFDLWEELDADHFFTKQVQRRALAEGAQFAREFNDTGAARFYEAQADALGAQLQGFWSAAQGRVNAYHAPGRSGIDCAVLLGANHGWNQSSLAASLDETQFGPATQRILATLKVYLDAFRSLYPINHKAPAPEPVLVGRYPEDEYSGFERKGGNPWYLCTLAAAETLYDAVDVLRQAGHVAVTNTTLDFFGQFAPSVGTGVYSAPSAEGEGEGEVYVRLLDGMRQQADGLVRLAASHAFANGSMSEQIDKASGAPTGARDLAWSYAAFLTSQRAARGQPVF